MEFSPLLPFQLNENINTIFTQPWHATLATLRTHTVSAHGCKYISAICKHNWTQSFQIRQPCWQDIIYQYLTLPLQISIAKIKHFSDTIMLKVESCSGTKMT